MNNILTVPSRPVKPRNEGITMMIDSGLSCRQVEDSLESTIDYVDYVKLGWGTAVITKKLDEKLAIYRQAGIPVCLGGTFFELAVLQNKVDKMVERALYHGIEMFEVSDGAIELKQHDKLDYIHQLSDKFKVLSEVGSKDDTVVMAPSLWVESIQKELEAGAWKVIAEGRESGTAGLYRNSKELRTGLVDEIVLNIPHENIIWEAPLKDQQVWFIEKFGSNVNLGNITPESIIGLETLRLGLRGDTVQYIHA